MATDEKLERLFDKIDEINKRLANIDQTLAVQQKDVEHHIYRTGLAEKQIQSNVENLEVVTKHITYVNGVIKFIGLLGLCVSVVIGLGKLF